MSLTELSLSFCCNHNFKHIPPEKNIQHQQAHSASFFLSAGSLRILFTCKLLAGVLLQPSLGCHRDGQCRPQGPLIQLHAKLQISRVQTQTAEPTALTITIAHRKDLQLLRTQGCSHRQEVHTLTFQAKKPRFPTWGEKCTLNYGTRSPLLPRSSI